MRIEQILWTLTCAVVLYCGQCNSDAAVDEGNSILRVGHLILPSESTANWPATTFMLNDFDLIDGVVFAFSAYFLNTNDVKFQIWRPRADVGEAKYELVYEWPFAATRERQREELYILTQFGQDCIRVYPSDRLGIYSPESPGSVVYTFESGVSVLQHTVDNATNPTQPGDVAHFDSLPFPYKFSAAIYIHTNLSQYDDPTNPSCNTDVRIPEDADDIPSTISPPAGGSANPDLAGATGPQGPPGPQGPNGVAGAAGLPGLNGRDGSNGANGLAGPSGPVGATGSQGPAGPPGHQVASAAASAGFGNCAWCDQLFTPYVSLGFLVWLVIVTIVLIILIVVIACRANDPLNMSNMRWTGSDLWKAYQDDQMSKPGVGYDNDGLDHNGLDQQTNYSYVEEGRTAF